MNKGIKQQLTNYWNIALNMLRVIFFLLVGLDHKYT